MLVTMKEILDHAKKGGYGVTAPNVQSEDTVRAVLEVAEEYHAPMIVDVNAFIHTDLPWFIHMIRDLAEKVSVPVAINLDHGKSYEDIMLGINSGFTSIMVDRSSLSYEENVEQTKEVVKMCKPLGISVEAELGHVGMGNNYAVDGVNNLTVPNEAADFIKETGVDCLAVAIGTAHGRYTGTPHIDFERLKQLVEACGDTPLVLHGGSGLTDNDFKRAIQEGISKINIFTDINVAAVEAEFRKFESMNKGIIDLIPAAVEAVKQETMKKMILFSSNGKGVLDQPSQDELVKAVVQGVLKEIVGK